MKELILLLTALCTLLQITAASSPQQVSGSRQLVHGMLHGISEDIDIQVGGWPRKRCNYEMCCPLSMYCCHAGLSCCGPNKKEPSKRCSAF